MKRSRLIVPAVLGVAMIGTGVVVGCGDQDSSPADAASVRRDAGIDARTPEGMDAVAVDAAVADAAPDGAVDAMPPDTPA